MAKRDVVRFSLIAAVFLLVFLPPFAKYQELRSKNRMLESKIKLLTEETKKLDTEKKRLQQDITYIEKKAREKIGIVRKGEIIIKRSAAK